MYIITKNHLVLIGFMGTGKTTIGSAIAKIVGIPFLDLDQEVARYAKRSISEIFATMGEPYFRQLESELLETLLHKISETSVLATGGGIVLRGENRKLLQEHSFIVHTRANQEEIIRRLHVGQEERPLLKGNLVEKVDLLLKQRSTLYDYADFAIQTDEMSIDEAALKIIAAWNDYRTSKKEQVDENICNPRT